MSKFFLSFVSISCAFMSGWLIQKEDERSGIMALVFFTMSVVYQFKLFRSKEK